MSTYVIGDVQGCFAELQALLSKVRFRRRRDQLWFVGDLINRGPESLATLRFVKGLGDAAVTVLGNHDLHFLAIALGGHAPRPADTLDALLNAEDCRELAQWLRRQPLLHCTKGFVMAHAGVPHIWRLKQAKRRAAEVETALRGDACHPILSRIYGDEPRRWSKSLAGVERLRIIVNYFTRMRFVGAAGELQLSRKGSAVDAPPGYSPWFAYPPRIKRPILFGHWAALNGVRGERAIGVDTGCVWGGKLTAYRLEDGKHISVASAAARVRESLKRPIEG